MPLVPAASALLIAGEQALSRLPSFRQRKCNGNSCEAAAGSPGPPMRSLVCIAEGMAMKATKVKKRRKRRVAVAAPAEKVSATPAMIFSSDLLTPEEERELLSGFWECKLELV